MTLTEFIAARLEEDEALAKRGEEVFVIGWPDYQTFDGPELDDANRYLDRFGPARVLRQVTAMRAILADLDLSYPDEEYLHRQFAVIWSDHEQYDESWRP